MRPAVPDFMSMSIHDLDALAIQRAGELGAEGLEPGDVLRAIDEGRAIVERRPYGFAVVERTSAQGGCWVPHLWLLYVEPGQRSRGVGRTFVRELLKLHSQTHHMSLYCHGARRRKFFGSCGFVVESKQGEMRRMTTNKDRM